MIMIWVLRTLHFGRSSREKLRKYKRFEPAKELCSLDSRDFLKKIE